MPNYRTTSMASPRKCPSTGLTCDAWVCNEGEFGCDPVYAASLKPRPAPAPMFARDEVIETDDGIILSGPAEEGPRFAIED